MEENKVKAWFSENKDEIKSEVKDICRCAILIGFGYFVGSKITQSTIATGLMVFHNEGFIKLFNPSTNAEIDADELVKLLKERRRG